jgi:hypothetical protein
MPTSMRRRSSDHAAAKFAAFTDALAHAPPWHTNDRQGKRSVFSDPSNMFLSGVFLRSLYCAQRASEPYSTPQMNVYLTLETLAIALALLCVALMPASIRIDTGLARRIVPLDRVPGMRWPALLTRAGLVCLLASFVLLLVACYYILAGTGW